MITDSPGSRAAYREVTAELIDVLGIIDRKGKVFLEFADNSHMAHIVDR